MLLNEGFQDYLAKPVRRFYLERMLRKYMPAELAVSIYVDDIPESKEKTEDASGEQNKEAPAKDPRIIDFDTGLRNLGGQMEAFASVVNAYYNEGVNKIEKVPKLLEDKMIDNYIVEVHALKSSSAAIGANAMSTLFRELEFAGKASNLEFIESHSGKVFEIFKDVLDVVKDYLTKNGILENTGDESEPEGEVVTLDTSIIDELIDQLAKFNIKATEEKINECCTINYGKEINQAIRQIKSQLDIFDYHKAKELLTDLKNKEEK